MPDEGHVMMDGLSDAVPRRLHIGGRWVESSDRARIAVVDPATEAVVAEVASATPDDAAAAVEAASAAGFEWAATPPRQRGEVLRRVFELMTERGNDLARLISTEEGKTLAEGLGEVAYAAEFFRWYAEEAVRTLGDFQRAPGGDNYILVDHAPVGVSFLVTPWNFPAAMITRKVAPALAAGCTCVVKPASATPLTALALAALFVEAGVPQGVVNVIPSRRSSEISKKVLADERVGKLSFTGSTEVGRQLLVGAAARIVHCSMELGGNAPLIVLDDADLERAVDGALIAKMRNCGESCIAANRFYVHSSLVDAFCDQLAERMSVMRIGPGLEEGTEVGPLVDAHTRDKVAHLVDDAVERGATVLTGGRKPPGKGFYYEPTVLRDVPVDADILQTEIFGPVAPVVAFDDVGDVVRLANATIFGLAAYVFGETGRALKVAQSIEAGIIGVNRGFVSDPAAPFGGFKQSGIGREGSRHGMYEFLEARYMAVDW